MGQGVSFGASYNYSKYMESVAYLNANDARPSSVISTVDHPHRVILNGIYELPGEANLTVLPRPDAGLSLEIVEGWQDPVQGWLTKGISSVRPAPVAIYHARGETTYLIYVIAPTPAGSKDPVRAVEPLGGDPAAARIVFNDARTYEVRFTPGKPAAWNIVPAR
jgi:hypothetical protein